HRADLRRPLQHDDEGLGTPATLDQARSRLPVEVAHLPAQPVPVWYAVVKPAANVVGPQGKEGGQVLGASWSQGVARATTSDSSGSALRIRSSSSVSTWWASSSESR